MHLQIPRGVSPQVTEGSSAFSTSYRRGLLHRSGHSNQPRCSASSFALTKLRELGHEPQIDWVGRIISKEAQTNTTLKTSFCHSSPTYPSFSQMKSAAFLIAVAVSFLASGVDAEEKFLVRIPNSANVPGVKAIGHTDGTGDSSKESAFGKAFESAGLAWTVGLCEADTDGDGQTNGQELGDPCCEWRQGDTPRWTEGVSHPSDASKTSNDTLWANINCTAVTTSALSGAGRSLLAQGSVSFASALVVGIAAMVNFA